MPANPVLPQQFGRYRILDKVGEGGMGTVYLAEDTKLGRRVALKVPRFDPVSDPGHLQRFYREARTAAGVEHPNVCPVFDFGEIDGIHYLTMPYIDGTPLSQLAAGGEPWPPRQAAELICQLAEAVHALHRQGLVHRDLKPSNVMVRLEGEPVLMDFGLAKQLQSPDQNLTATGAVMGTPGYMSPEQVLDASHSGPGTDIYSLGVMLYELVTGRRPFEGPVAAVYAQILHSTPTPPSSVRPGLDVQLDAICLKALAKKPEERFATAQALADALVRYLSEQTIPAVAWAQPIVAARPVQDDTRLTCPSCGKQLRVPPMLQGKRLKCPRCQTRLGGPSGAQHPAVPTAGATAVIPTPSPAPVDTVGETHRQPPVAQVAPARRASPVLLIVVLAILATALVWALILFLNRDTGTDDPTKKEHDTNSLGMRLVRIDPGKFRMGSPQDEEERDNDEGPQHEVEITRSFYLGATEVTVGQFRQFVDATGYQTEAERDGTGGFGLDAGSNTFLDGPAYNWKNPGYPQTDEHPVVNVTWNDAVKFCEWLSKKEGKTYELPTEAEWEYACRAGTTTRFWTGNDAEGLVGAANMADASARRQFPEQNWKTIAGDDGHAVAAPVGRFKPNPWGLHDMHGNVWEWCADGPRTYEDRPVKDPRGPDNAADRILRGGSWYGSSFHGRSADRYQVTPSTRNINYGFRVVLRPDR